MTGDLVPAGQAVRVIPSEIGPVIPVVDISEMIGVDDSTISKKFKAFEKWLSPCSVFIPLSTTGGMQRFRCLNRKGFDRLLILMRPKKTGEDSIDRLFELRESILEKMGTESKELVPVKQPADIHNELKEAALLAETCRKSSETFQAAILRKHGKSELADALQGPASSVIHGEPGWYNPTQLAAMCNDPMLTAERLNWYLCNNPRDPEHRSYQYRDPNRIWRLTTLGKEHGREYWYSALGGHQEIRIEWRESILYASGLKHPIANDQTALPARV
jgi:hypothetical protein